MTKTYNPLNDKLHMVINDLYPPQVVYLWNTYCRDQRRDEDLIHPMYTNVIEEELKKWSRSDIVIGLRRSDDRDNWFIVSEATSEIICCPDWELGEHIDEYALVEWLLKGNRWKDYDALAAPMEASL